VHAPSCGQSAQFFRSEYWKFAENVCSSDTNKNANNTNGWSEFLRVFSTRRENSTENMEANQ